MKGILCLSILVAVCSVCLIDLQSSEAQCAGGSCSVAGRGRTTVTQTTSVGSGRVVSRFQKFASRFRRG